MQFTEEEIQQMERRFGDSLRKGQAEFSSSAPTISEMQEWMVRHHVEHPRVLETMLKKLGPGVKAGKKNMP